MHLTAYPTVAFLCHVTRPPEAREPAPIVARYAGSGPMSWAGYLRVSSRSTWMPPTSEGQVDPEPVRLARLRANGLSL
jgi:hypothetical protein